jgi:hypothetical protein
MLLRLSATIELHLDKVLCFNLSFLLFICDGFLSQLLHVTLRVCAIFIYLVLLIMKLIITGNSNSHSGHQNIPSNEECGIRDVWAHNLHEEFKTIRKVVQKYHCVAMVSTQYSYSVNLFCCL